VFGAKLMWSQLPEFHALAGQLSPYRGLGRFELLERLFDGPRYVRVTRRDKVRQAVSMWRALQTRSWRLERDPGDHSPAVLQYRYEGINHLVQMLHEEDRAWDEFFAAHGATVHSVAYEDDLEVDRDATVRAVLEFIGVTPPTGWQAVELLKRQADALSDDWVAAYHRDVAQQGEQRSAAGVAAL
jgi:trehalose 2-sulfotransferase